MVMNNSTVYSGTVVMLTVEGRLALAADALAAAEKARNEPQRKRLCLNAMNHLRAIVEG
jgi:hypothetical protein